MERGEEKRGGKKGKKKGKEIWGIELGRSTPMHSLRKQNFYEKTFATYPNLDRTTPLILWYLLVRPWSCRVA
jgi:hypothetical protein